MVLTSIGNFFETYHNHFQDSHDGIKLLQAGSCGLHVVHGSLQYGHKAAEWSVNSYLRGLYYLFKDSPARRAQYTEATSSTLFPLKFCQVRWVENNKVAERALAVLPHVKKYVSCAKLPSTVTSKNIKELCSDPLAPAKIAFFASVAAALEPFLTKYQTSAPLMPFLYDDLIGILRVLMSRYVKKDLLDIAKTGADICKIDGSSKEIRCRYKEVDLGVAATKLLTESKVSDAARMAFRMQCIEFLAAATGKIQERSPLQYKIVTAVSCFVPKKMVNNPAVCQSRMAQLLQIFYDSKRISADIADKAKLQFSKLCSRAADDLKSNFTSYDCAQRLDTFYYGILGNDSESAELWSVVRKTLVLSHGNANVESGFSVNGDILIENLHEDSLIAQRVVYDGIIDAGGVLSVNVTKEMMQSVRAARSRYDDALKRHREQASAEMKKSADRKRLAAEIASLETKKKKLMKDMAADKEMIESQIKELNKKL